MSATYSDLTCAFPNSLDPNLTFSDVTSANKDLVNQYYTYKESGDDSSAIDILTQHPDLKTTIITHETFQLLYDMCIAQERFYTSDFRTTVTTLVHNKGEFDNAVQYSMFDLVVYKYKAYLCNSSDVPIGTLPTTDSWDRITFQGPSGTGMAFFVTWDSAHDYVVQDCVPYGDKLYVCVQANTNMNPADNPNYWTSIITVPQQIMISSGQPENQNENDIWYKTNSTDNSFEVWKNNGDNTYSQMNPKVNPNYIEQDSTHRLVSDFEKNTWNGKTNRYQFDVTIPFADWTGNTAPYTQTVNVAGLTAAMCPIMDLVQSNTIETAQSQLDAYSCINRATTADSSLTLMCYYAKPDVDLTVHLEVIV